MNDKTRREFQASAWRNLHFVRWHTSTISESASPNRPSTSKSWFRHAVCRTCVDFLSHSHRTKVDGLFEYGVCVHPHEAPFLPDFLTLL